jgi:transcriptional regulator with XRE-family HTH domain
MIAERINIRLKVLGMSRYKLAQVSGYDPTAINRYCKGTVKNPKREILEDLADALECTTDYLNGLTENPKERVGDKRRVLYNGVKPYCPVCKCNRYMYNNHYEVNIYCGHCGTSLKWED